MRSIDGYNIIICLDKGEYDKIKKDINGEYFKYKDKIYLSNGNYRMAVHNEKKNAIVLHHQNKKGPHIELENTEEGFTIYRLFHTAGGDPELRKIQRTITEYLYGIGEKIKPEEFCQIIYEYVRFNIKEIILDEILAKLAPVIIALQVYTSVDKDEGGWYYWGKTPLPEWVPVNISIKMTPAHLVSFPKKEAFMLIGDAQWDYYASLFNMTFSVHKNIGIDNAFVNTCSIEENEVYNKKNKLAILLKLFMRQTGNDETIKDLLLSFSEDIPAIKNKYFNLNINKKTYEISFAEFVTKIRELTAILANTININDSGNTYCYKGINVNAQYRDEILKKIFNVSIEDLNSMRHSKLEGQPDLYKKLTEQLDLWLKADNGINYFIVLEGLNVLITRLRGYSNA